MNDSMSEYQAVLTHSASPGRVRSRHLSTKVTLPSTNSRWRKKFHAAFLSSSLLSSSLSLSLCENSPFEKQNFRCFSFFYQIDFWRILVFYFSRVIRFPWVQFIHVLSIVCLIFFFSSWAALFFFLFKIRHARKRFEDSLYVYSVVFLLLSPLSVFRCFLSSPLFSCFLLNFAGKWHFSLRLTLTCKIHVNMKKKKEANFSFFSFIIQNL